MDRTVETTTDARVLPLVAAYLRRQDLEPRKIGPKSRAEAPAVTDRDVSTDRQSSRCSCEWRNSAFRVPSRARAMPDGGQSDVRVFGALALAAYQRPKATRRWRRSWRPGDTWIRTNAADFLLELGDRRGLPIRLEAFERGGELYGTRQDEDGSAIRLFACRDLRTYTQQPLPCDAHASPDVRAAQATAWRQWWNANSASFRIPSRAVALDLEAFPLISPIAIGDRIAR